MVKVAVTRFMVAAGREREFEEFMKDSMRMSLKAKGQRGAVLMKSPRERASYLLIAFWESEAAMEEFMKASEAREKVKALVSTSPKTERFDTVARVQYSRMYPT